MGGGVLALSVASLEYAHAAVVFSGTTTDTVSAAPASIEIGAKATFTEPVANELVVTIQNISTSTEIHSADVLNGFFFNYNKTTSPSLTLSSQTLAVGTYTYSSGAWGPASTSVATLSPAWNESKSTPSGYTTGMGDNGFSPSGWFSSGSKNGLVASPSVTLSGGGYGTVLYSDSATFTYTGYNGNLTDLGTSVYFATGTAQPDGSTAFSIIGNLQTVPEANYGWAAALLILPIGWQVWQRKIRSAKVTVA